MSCNPRAPVTSHDGRQAGPVFVGFLIFFSLKFPIALSLVLRFAKLGKYNDFPHTNSQPLRSDFNDSQHILCLPVRRRRQHRGPQQRLGLRLRSAGS